MEGMSQRKNDLGTTIRMLSCHETRVQKLNYYYCHSKKQQSTPDTITTRSLMLDERPFTMTCCNLINDTYRDKHPEANTMRNINLDTCKSQLPPTPPLPSKATRITPTERRRHSRKNRLALTKSYCKLFTTSSRANLLVTLVGLLCVVSLFISLAESLVLDTQQLYACPFSQCKCKWSNGKRSAQCDRRNLRAIPEHVPADTQVLDMSGNPLGELSNREFQDARVTNLQKLFLSECLITRIDDDAFIQLTNLVELDLSHNSLEHVPTRALEKLRKSLRKLSLAYNHILTIDSYAFNPLNHLATLDLTNSSVATIGQNAFSGLTELRELKLIDNRLTQLPVSALTDLREYSMVDLYGNPWHCDCELRQSIDYMHKHQIQLPIEPTCATPTSFKDMRWQSVKPEDYLCPPVILDKPGEIVIGAGSNVTLACSARGSPPLNFVWFQDERNLTVQGAGNNNNNNGQADPPSTKLLLEKRYEIQEDVSLSNISTSYLFLMNLKVTDTSVFLCWVQNAAGYSFANFSLTVDGSMPPSHLSSYGTASGAINGLGGTLGRLFGIDPDTASNTQIVIVVLAFLLLLAATIICLFVLKQISKGRSSKSSASSDNPKAQQANGKLSGSNKFAHIGGAKSGANGKLFATNDYVDNGGTDDEDDDHSSGEDGSTSGSQSSCTKKGNTRVLAAEELDGFIDHLRSGIISMDYHSMSPVIQFNNQKPPPQQQQHQLQLQDQQQQQHHQLTHLNHFPSASNASTQQAYYGAHQATNGSNSMATTVSDLSPSSGSASTSFANNTNPAMMGALQQRQHYVPANMATLLRHQQQPIPNCDYPPQQFNATTSSYTSDYQSGYSEDPLNHQHHQIMPPMYSDMEATGSYHYKPATLINAPAQMQQQQQQQAYHIRQDSPQEGAFNEIL